MQPIQNFISNLLHLDTFHNFTEYSLKPCYLALQTLEWPRPNFAARYLVH